MKQYPHNILETDISPFAKAFHTIPTAEAVQNFTSYLEPDELEFYNGLPTTQRLSIHLSVNPFTAFKDLLKQTFKVG